jgi:hypothetical protein
MYHKFFEPDQQYVGFFNFPEDPEMVPGHLVIRKNTIEGQLYRAPEDIIEKPDLPFGFGLNTSKILNAVGVFRLKDGKDVEVSIFGIQIVSYSSSHLGFYKIYCKSIILNANTIKIEEVFPEKLVVKIRGLEEWFEKKGVHITNEGFKRILSFENRIIEEIYENEHVKIDLVCYVNFLYEYRNKTIKELVSFVVLSKNLIQFSESEKWIEKLRQICSLFFRKQLKIEEISFFVPEIDTECYYVYSDAMDYYKGEIKSRNEAIIRYSDTDLFRNLINNFLQAEPRLRKLMDTFFLMELNHSLYNENAFLTWVFELDSFIKKGKQKNISKREAMKDLSHRLISKLDEKDDPLLEELFKKWHSLSNEKAKFYGETLQARLVRYFGLRKFFKDLISTNSDDFFERVVKTRNHLAHPSLSPHSKVIPTKELFTYQSKLRLAVYCLILVELGMDEELMIQRMKASPASIIKPLN